MTQTIPDVTLDMLEQHVDTLDLERAATTYEEYGCLVVRGLFSAYVEAIRADAEFFAQQSIRLLPQAKESAVGWTTPDGTLFIPAPDGFDRDKQVMVLGMNYRTSAAFFQSGFDEKVLDLVEAIMGPDIELFNEGQSLYKEPVGGHPKLMHQDSAYFEHRFDGPLGMLNYLVPTDYNRGALHVVPGSHKWGQLKHGDTFSHLGLDEKEWPVERGLCIAGEPGDAILFHVRTIHGSPVNRSDGPRPVFIHRYRRPGDYVTVGAATSASRAEAEKRAAEAKAENQKGFMVRGRRRWDG